MCGIVGLWNMADADIGPAEFDRFVDSLAHRGPDGRGVFHDVDRRLWLGHRRLSILDLSETGAQPMESPDKRHVITYNGEIYNYLELRAELEKAGFEFRGSSDTEVLLAAYRHWGPACQLKLNGMWGFAIWDREERTLFLSRDRFGIKPLYYFSSDGRFAFASELKAFVALSTIPFAIDEATLASSVANMIGLEGTERTWLAGVSRLPGGCCMVVDHEGRTTVQRWWDTLDHLEPVPRSYEDQVEKFRTLFVDACRLRMRSDVPLATSLSGGLDSSAVFCTLQHLGQNPGFSQDWQRAFVAGFEGSGIDERQYALRVVEHAKASATVTEISEIAFAPDIDKIVFHLEEVNSVLLAGLWMNYRAMRERGVYVSLDGHGADEQLGGYHFIVETEMMRAAASLRVSRFLDLRRTFLGFAGGSNPIQPMSLKSALRYGYQYSDSARFLRRFIRPKGAVPPLPARAPLTEFLGDPAYERDPRYQGLSGLGKSLYVYFHYTVLPTILRNFDRASMGNGIETRMPFMDWRLVSYVFSLPDQAKMGHGYAKRILRDATKGVIPDDIRLRTNKIGFTSPMAKWLGAGMRDYALDILHSDGFRQSPLFDGKSIAASGSQLLEQNNLPGYAATVWPAINAHVLAERFRHASQAARRQ